MDRYSRSRFVSECRRVCLGFLRTQFLPPPSRRDVLAYPTGISLISPDYWSRRVAHVPAGRSLAGALVHGSEWSWERSYTVRACSVWPPSQLLPSRCLRPGSLVRRSRPESLERSSGRALPRRIFVASDFLSSCWISFLLGPLSLYNPLNRFRIHRKIPRQLWSASRCGRGARR